MYYVAAILFAHSNGYNSLISFSFDCIYVATMLFVHSNGYSSLISFSIDCIYVATILFGHSNIYNLLISFSLHCIYALIQPPSLVGILLDIEHWSISLIRMYLCTYPASITCWDAIGHRTLVHLSH